MNATRALLFLAAVLCCVLAAAMAFPQGYKQPSYASGKVKIQTYRGPNKEKIGYDYFAPWGYYVTQPEDDKAYGYH